MHAISNASSTASMLHSNLLALSMCFSACAQGSLKPLLLERASTTCVFVLIFRALGVHAPILRALVQNTISMAAEVVFIGAHLRYMFLRSIQQAQLHALAKKKL